MSDIQAPQLDIDKQLGEPTGFGKVERRVIANLLNHIQQGGFTIAGVWDGDEFHPTNNIIKNTMELVFNLDECHIYIRKGRAEHWVYIVLGNSDACDIIADWCFSNGDRDGFDKLMEKFEPERYE